MTHVARFALQHSRVVIGVFLAVTVVLAISATRIETAGATESLYPDDSRVDAIAEELQATFRHHDRLLLVTSGDIYSGPTMARVAALNAALQRLAGVEDVTSVATAKRMVDDDGFLIVDDLIPRHAPGVEPDAEELAAARAYLAGSPMYQNVTLVSSDGRHASFIIEMADGLDANAFAKSVVETVRTEWVGEYALAGQAFTSMELQSIIGRDLPVLGGLALVVIVLMLFLNFRTLQGTLLPLALILLGVVWGMGLFGLLGGKLMALTVIGPIAVMAVASSFIINMLGRYYFELAHGAGKRVAIDRMLGETGLGVIVSGVAISAAMSTFMLSSLQMVRGLGLVALLGVLASLLASMVLLPALLNVLPVPKHVGDPENPGGLARVLASLGRLTTRRPRVVVLTAVAVVLAGLVGVPRIVTDTSILAFFPEGGATRSSVATVEEVLGGSSTITVWLQGDLGDPALLAAMEAYQHDVANLPELGAGQSIVNVIRALNLTLTGEDALPRTREAVAQELLLYQSSGDVSDLTRFMTLDQQQGVINFVAKSMSTERVAAVTNEMTRLAEARFGDLATVRFTGNPLLEREIEQAMRHDFVISLTLAIALVLIIDSFVRSFRAAAVTIIVLLSTVALQYGLLGWLGLPLNLATMLMGALAIGVGDYAIHLTVRYMEERRHGRDPEQAVMHTLYSTGRQILFTALTLGAGFGALAFASFVPVATLGRLMLLTVGLVGVATLTLLPAASLRFLRDPHARVHLSKELTHEEV